MKIYLNNAYLAETEVQAAADFANGCPGVDESMPFYIDALLKICHVIEAGPATEDGFGYFAWERFILAPYTLRTIWRIGRTGYYSEALTLLRHLTEVFVQMRYFAAHKDKLKGHHQNLHPKKGKVQFKQMFDAVSPGYYDKFYGLPSNVAHGGISLSVFSGLKIDPNEMKVYPPQGVAYDEWKASIVFNQVLMLMSGFLVQVPNWFPNYAADATPPVESMRVEARDQLLFWRVGHKAMHPKTKDWHERCDALMGKA